MPPARVRVALPLSASYRFGAGRPRARLIWTLVVLVLVLGGVLAKVGLMQGTGGEALRSLHDTLHALGIRLIIARAKSNVRGALHGHGIAAGLVLLAYRPGGPLDLLVGLLALTPIGIALAGAIWPPVARGDVAFPAIVWLGILALLCLVPSITGVVNQLLAFGSRTISRTRSTSQRARPRRRSC